MATCGVYYLTDGLDVLYVGKSINVPKRIKQHQADREDFSQVFVDWCEPDQLNELEAKGIADFKPKWNVNSNLQA